MSWGCNQISCANYGNIEDKHALIPGSFKMGHFVCCF
jgi:hypothetical protein